MKVRSVLISLLFLMVAFAILHRPMMKKVCPLKYSEEILLSANENDLSPFLIASIIRVESSFDKRAVSRKGAVGLMQLMPSTAAWLGEIKEIKIDEYSLEDPVINIALGCYYFRTLLEEFGKIPALAAYNAGRGNLEKWLKEEIWDGSWENRTDIPFPETRAYVIKVIIFEHWYKYLYGNSWPGERVLWQTNLKEIK